MKNRPYFVRDNFICCNMKALYTFALMLIFLVSICLSVSPVHAAGASKLISSDTKLSDKKSIDELNNSDVTIGVVEGFIFGDQVKQHLPNAKISYYETREAAFKALSLGSIDAVVDDDAEAVELVLLVEAFQLGQVATVDLTLTDDIEGHIGYAVDDTGIGNNLSRHIVNNDVVVDLLQFFYQEIQTVAHQQLRGVRRRDAGRQHIYVVLGALGVADACDIVNGAAEERGQAIAVSRTGELTGRTLTDVGIDEDNLLACHAQRHGEVT